MPELTPQEAVLADLQAQHADQKLVAKQTKQGLVVCRLPTPAEIDTWQGSKGSRRKSEDDLVIASAIYPEASVLKQYFQASPLMGSALVISLKAASLGVADPEVADVTGFPSDLADERAQAMGSKSLGRDVWQVQTDQGRVILRLPHGVELDNWETSKLNPRKAAEGLVIGCVLDPEPDIVRAWFLKRPLMGFWLSNKLRQWCVGEVEELQGK